MSTVIGQSVSAIRASDMFSLSRHLFHKPLDTSNPLLKGIVMTTKTLLFPFAARKKPLLPDFESILGTSSFLPYNISELLTVS
jgi:hypothetical protein